MNVVPVIYVASPYSDDCEAIRVMRAELITKIIGLLTEKHGHAFIGPITASHQYAKHMKNKCGKFAKWADIDLSFILKADEVWVVCMDGWFESIGVSAEIAFAHSIGKPIKYIHPETLKTIKRS